MIRVLLGLAIVAGLAEYRPGRPPPLSPTPELGEWGPWLPATVQPRQLDDTVYDLVAPPALAELHHEEEWLPHHPRRTWVQAEALAAWRRRMDAWLDHEWLAWRDLLHTYPDPEGAA